MSKNKTARDYWYSDVDIMQLLMEKSQNHYLYKVIDSAVFNDDMNLGIDPLSVQVRVKEAIEFLNNDQNVTTAVIPINIGSKNNQGEWIGRHWVGLVIHRLENGTFEALYCDSAVSDNSQVEEIPDLLKQQIKWAGINSNNINDLSQQQQDNGYDCGPWTVFNLDYIARNGALPVEKVNQDFIPLQRESLLPYYDDSTDEEEDVKTIYNHDLSWYQEKWNSKLKNDLILKSQNIELDISFMKMTFLLHELAVRLLKSKEVNKLYYPVKKQKLQKTLELRKEEFDQSIIERINNLLKKDYSADFDTTPLIRQMLKNTPGLFLATQQCVKEKNKFLVNRKLLPGDLFLDENYDALDWLSSIRLVNCSAKRTIRNLKDMKQNSFDKEEASYLGVRLNIPNTDQSIEIGYDLLHTGAKKSLVKDIGAYQNILGTVNSPS